MRLRTSQSLSWTSTSLFSLNVLLMNMNQYASMETIDLSIPSLSSFFEMKPFLVNEH